MLAWHRGIGSKWASLRRSFVPYLHRLLMSASNNDHDSSSSLPPELHNHLSPVQSTLFGRLERVLQADGDLIMIFAFYLVQCLEKRGSKGILREKKLKMMEKWLKILIKKIIFLWTKKQSDVRTQLHKSERRGNATFSGTFAAADYETFVFVPFMRIINFTGLLSEMLLNRILFTFTRKMETSWLSARLVNFPLSFFMASSWNQTFWATCFEFLIKDIW